MKKFIFNELHHFVDEAFKKSYVIGASNPLGIITSQYSDIVSHINLN